MIKKICSNESALLSMLNDDKLSSFTIEDFCLHYFKKKQKKMGNRHHTDRQIDRQTDRQTDRQGLIEEKLCV